jgi:hypothetical protein
MGLPLDTPVGTEIVCIDASDLKYLPSGESSGVPSGLVKDALYVLFGWVEFVAGFHAVIVNVDGLDKHQGFDPRRFRRLKLAGLDALLDVRERVAA